MKKVLLSAYACSPTRGSEENNGWCWATGLAAKGYKVWCLTNVQDQKEKEAERIRLGLDNLRFITVSLPWGLDEMLLKPSSKVIYLHYFLWKKKATRKALKLHYQHRFDVGHHVTYGSFQQGSCLYKLDDCKIIYGPVGGGQMALPIFKSYFGSAWSTEQFRALVSKFLLNYNISLVHTLRKANTILTINKETEDLLKTSKYYKKGQNYMVTDTAIPTAYENMPYLRKEKEDTLHILWVGRLIPRKGINLSLKALSHLSKDLAYELTIVGDGEQESQVEGWINQFGLDPLKIRRCGHIPFTQMAEEYRKAHIMLFCSLRETAGNQVMEAMAFSLPIIALNISGMVNMVPKNCGIKITPTSAEGTAKDIAKAIEELQDHALRTELGKNAYNYAMETTWKNKIELVTSKYY